MKSKMNIEKTHPFMAGKGGSPLRGLAVARDCRTKRVSSWDRTGANNDFIKIKPRKTVKIADIKGAGCITHLWFTVNCVDPLYLRKVLLRFYWDNEKTPSVESPIADFFGCGHNVFRHYTSLPLSVVTKQDNFMKAAAMNCYFPMPFGKRARLEVVNDCDVEISNFYFYVDYEEYDELPDDMLRFHAKFNRNNPCKAKKTDINLTGKDNYVICKARGRGHFAGCNLSVHNLSAGWFGEGDDMFFIDGEKFPPSLHGTGTEDYFCAAWGFPSCEYAGPYHGITISSGDIRDYTGRWTAYRFHIEDPVVFRKSLVMSIEHGHANDRADDVSSVAYWYQDEPHTDYWEIPDVEGRLPRPHLPFL